MSVRSSPLEAVRAALGAVRDDISDLVRNAPAARFIGEQVTSQLLTRLCASVRRPATAPSRGAPSVVAGAIDEAVPSSSADRAQPCDNYDLLTARQVVEMLAGAEPEMCRRVLAHEANGRQRRTVLEAAARGLGENIPARQ